MAGISITLAGNFQKLDELKDKAGKTAASIKSAFGSNIGKAMFAGIAAGATAAFAGVVAAVKSAVDAGGELNDMMARTGASGKGLLILQRAFENAGLAAEQVPDALNRMQKALAGVNEDGEATNAAFAKLGLSIGELTSMDPVAAFMKISEAISSIQNPAQRTAVAMELFGKSGAKMLAVFQDASAFESAKQQLGGLADLLPEISGNADIVGDAFGSLDTKFRQVGAGALKELMPQLLELSEWINKTDFTQIGTEIGIMAEYLVLVGDAVGGIVKNIPQLKALEKIAAFAGSLNPTKGTALPSVPGVSIGADGKAVVEDAPASDSKAPPPAAKPPGGSGMTAATGGSGLADAMADAKKLTAEKAKSRAAAAEEYRLERDILAAKLSGDDERLGKLQREKAIREEMKRLESSGFTALEARKPAEEKVDTEKRVGDREVAQQSSADEKKQIADTLAGRLENVKGRQAGQQFQSTIGAVSSMQRIGGGGGATSSGLDYARQTNDLQRESNDIQREMLALLRPPLD